MKRLSPALWSFHPGSMPAMARANYRRELIAAAFLPFMLASVEGGILSVLVRITFEDYVPRTLLNYAVAVIAATPALANIASFVWVRISHGREKIRFITAMQVMMIAMTIALALAPRSALGLGIVVAAAVGARMSWTGYITIRSTVWRCNYPRHVRARVTGKIATVQVLMIALLAFGLGAAMDAEPNAFRALVPLGAVIALVGVMMWRGVRVRGQRQLLAAERAGVEEDEPSFNPLIMLRILAADRPFSAFMFWQFVLGMGNLMLTPVLVLVLRERMGLEYSGSMLITTSIPMVLMPLAIPLWARLLDRTHIIRFRAVHSWMFVLAALLYLVAARAEVVELFYLAAAVQGIAFGGGALAWNLGHLDFAPAHLASQYMGIHVTLTGVRGMFAPFLGVGLYQWLQNGPYPNGSWVFGVCLGLSLAGALGYVHMALRTPHEVLVRTEPAETAPPTRAGIGT